MYQVIIVIHVLLGLGVVGLVLMQQGKGADAGAAFGTGSSGSVFGAQGAASFLSRATAILATLFFTTSLGLAVLNGQKGTANDFISGTITPQLEGAAVPAVTEPKIAEDIPAQTEQIPAAPSAPASIAPTVIAPIAPVENLSSEPVVKEGKSEVIQDAPSKAIEKPIDDKESKATAKPKVVKKAKHSDAKVTKKTEKTNKSNN